MAFLQQLVVGAIILAAIAASEPNPSCVRTCGSLNIPYPFGTSEGCYLDPSFLITCNNSTPLLSPGNIIKVINISWDGELRVSNSIDRYCPGNSSSDMASEPTVLNFPVSHTKNKLTAVGCDTFGFINATEAQKKYSVGCLSLCDSIDSVVNGSCEGIGCCQTSIPKGMTSFAFTAGSLSNPSTVDNFNPCSFAFVVEEKAYNFSSLDLVNLQNRQTVPMVLGQLGMRHAEMLRKIRQPMHVRQRIANVTIPPTVLVIFANATPVMKGTHTSLMVATVMIYIYPFCFFLSFSHLAELYIYI